MIESFVETVFVAVQVKRVEDELLTDEVEGPHPQQKKTEDEAGGMEKTSTFSYKPHALQFRRCVCASDSSSSVHSDLSGLGSPQPDSGEASPNKRAFTQASTCDGQCRIRTSWNN